MLRIAAAARLVLPTLFFALLISGCGQPELVYLRVVEWLPALDPASGTELILPSAGLYAPELGIGWSRGAGPEGTQRTAHVRNKIAEVHFTVAAPGTHTLSMEIQPLSRPAGGPQSVTLRLNGEELSTLPLQEHWETHNVELPSEHLRIGHNLLRFEFAAASPRDPADDEEGRPVPVAARFRRLEVRGPLGRPTWPEQPVRFLDVPGATGDRQQAEEGVRTTSDARSATERSPTNDSDPRSNLLARLVMPTDSLLDLAFEVPDGARLLGRLIPRPAGESVSDVDEVAPRAAGGSAAGDAGAAGESRSGAAGEDGQVYVVIELTDEQGSVETLYEQELASRSFRADPGAAHELDVRLGNWAGEPVRLRLRVWGSVNAEVLWEDLWLTCRCEKPSVEIDYSDLRRSPVSGRLGRPDVFVIVLDAARADAFSAYGSRHETPAIDRLAAAGTKFARALTTSCWTGPSVPSMLTGRYPEAHGVEVWNRRLHGSVPTVTEILADAGYYTYLFSHHLIYRGGRTLRRGFEGIELVDHRERHRVPNPEELFVEDRPTFAFIHLLPPHAPYDPPAPYLGAYTDDMASEFDVSTENLSSYRRASAAVDEEGLAYARARYDENALFADSLVGQIVETLKERGRYEDALIVVLADHGEQFLEHGSFLHGDSLYDEVLRIPMIVKWPASMGGFAQDVAAPVSLVDLAPTLIDGLGVSDRRARFQGISLLPTVFEGVESDRALYVVTQRAARTDDRNRPLIAVQRGDDKLIFDPALRSIELYDLVRDPLERFSVASAEPVRAQLLLQALLAQRHRNQMALAGQSETPGFNLDPETLEQLRALGYIR